MVFYRWPMRTTNGGWTLRKCIRNLLIFFELRRLKTKLLNIRSFFKFLKIKISLMSSFMSSPIASWFERINHRFTRLSINLPVNLMLNREQTVWMSAHVANIGLTLTVNRDILWLIIRNPVKPRLTVNFLPVFTSWVAFISDREIVCFYIQYIPCSL